MSPIHVTLKESVNPKTHKKAKSSFLDFFSLELETTNTTSYDENYHWRKPKLIFDQFSFCPILKQYVAFFTNYSDLFEHLGR